MKKIILLFAMCLSLLHISQNATAQAGALDLSFNGTGRKVIPIGAYSEARDVAIQPDGKSVVIGYSQTDYSYYGNSGFTVVRLNADGSFDNSFGSGGISQNTINNNNYYYYNYAYAQSVALQPDGKILVGGYSYDNTYNNGYYVFTVIRLNSNGSLDNSFGNGTGVVKYNPSSAYNASSYLTSVKLQQDGKIVLAGTVYDYSYNYYGYYTYSFAAMRLNSDGSIDNSFNGNGISVVNFNNSNNYYYNYSWCYDAAIDQNNKIVLVGYAPENNGNNYGFGVARLNTDGSLDNSFNGSGYEVVHLNQDSYNSYDYCYSVAIQSDNKIVLGGFSYDPTATYDGSSNNSIYKFGVARLNNDGSPDLSFNGVGYAKADATQNSQPITNGYSYSYNYGYSLAIQDNQKIIIGGSVYHDEYDYNSGYNGSYQKFALARFTSSGTLDNTFGTNGTGLYSPNDENSTVPYSWGYRIAKQPDGKIMMSGTGYNSSNQNHFGLVRVFANNDCPSNRTIPANPAGCTAKVNDIAPHFELYNGETIQGITYTISGTTSASGNDDASGTVFNKGLSIITYTATIFAADETSFQRSCSFNVTVADVTAPTIQCPADVRVSVDQNSEYATNVNLGTPTGVDICGAVSFSNNAPSSFPSGVTLVTWTATDESGNTVTCTQKVTVILDNEPPVISCPANIVVNNTAGICSAVVDFAATATDNSGSATISYSIPSGSTFALGQTTVIVTAIDAIGNQSECSFTVTVVDNEAPKANCKPVTVTLSNGVASVTAEDINSFSSDNCGPVTIALSSSSKTSYSCADGGKTFPVTLIVTDSHNNSSTCIAQVTVKGEIPTCSIASVPTSSVYTGGISTNLYLGYGAQSTTLVVSAPANGAPYTYSWSGPAGLSSTTSSAPVFTATTAGQFTFVVTTTNVFGCSSTCSITICVTDIRVPGTNGSKVYVCHVPPGNTGNPQTLSISVNAVPSHLGNHAGDRLGTCGQLPCTVVKATNSITQATQTTKELAEGTSEEELSVVVSPNPSPNFFTLKLTSRYTTPVSLKVMDATGKVVDAKSGIVANSSIQIGHNYSSGTYYAEMTQGTRRKVVQLIKVTR